MRTSALRILAVAALASAGLTCADDPISGVRQVSSASFALAPSFAVAPQGGPQINVRRIRGVLRGSTDSSVAEATVEGDSAVLVFDRVQVRGDSSLFTLGVRAFDSSDVLVFQSEDPINVKPGDNPPASPELDYTAPDATVDSIDVAGASVSLDWAGSQANACRNRLAVADPTATTQQQLTVNGFAAGSAVANVRVGWTSRDTSVATVTAGGLVRARCSNKSTYVVARTFLDEADSILVSVTAPPFSLLMNPDSVSVPRGGSAQLAAVVVDENGNEVPAAGVTWHSSDPSRASVNSTGLVTGIANGRVQITAGSEGRITVGIVRVVRPPAARVIVSPGLDTAAVGQLRAFFARAADANGRIIGDASGFDWMSSDPSVASVDATSGLVTAHTVGEAFIFAKLDGVKDSIHFVVQATRPPGSIASRVVHAIDDTPLAGVTITGPGANSTTSDANGRFTLTGLQPGDDVTVSASGYVTITLFDAPVFPGTTLQLPDAPMVPANGTPGSMTGTVKHAIAQTAIGGIAVNAYTGVNAGPSPIRPVVTPVATTTTASNGSFTFNNLAAGIYTLVFSGEGYSDVVSVGIVVGGATTSQDEVLLPPAAASGALAIVLTWGSPSANVPADLDLHLTGPGVPDSASRFHVYRDSRRYIVTGDTIAALDFDRTQGPGPEVIGLRPTAGPGTYRLYVHNFSGRTVGTSRALADSSFARVDVYQNNRVIATFFPPTGVQGTLWKVFEYDGARIKPVNEIIHQENATALPMIVGPVDPWVLDVSRIAATLSGPKQ